MPFSSDAIQNNLPSKLRSEFAVGTPEAFFLPQHAPSGAPALPKALGNTPGHCGNSRECSLLSRFELVADISNPSVHARDQQAFKKEKSKPHTRLEHPS
jgi:hypothetical protein